VTVILCVFVTPGVLPQVAAASDARNVYSKARQVSARTPILLVVDPFYGTRTNPSVVFGVKASALPNRKLAALSRGGSVITVHWSADRRRVLTVDPAGFAVYPYNGAKQAFGRGTDLPEPDDDTLHDIHLGSVAWSPDGRRVAIASNERLTVYDLTSRARQVLATSSDFPNGFCSVAWSPLGDSIAFTVMGKDSAGHSLHHSDVWIVRPDGRKRQRLGRGESPAWSPDGRFLTVIEGPFRQGGKSIRRYDLASHTSRILMSARLAIFEVVAYAPDGTRMAILQSDEGAPGGSGLVLVDCEGRFLRKLSTLKELEFPGYPVQMSW
jgi:Tol biopolymer transport system component